MIQSLQSLQQHLEEQVDFLKNSIERFDAGYTNEAKRIAVILRTLMHDSPKTNSNSKSLLSQLGLKHQLLFYDTSFENEDEKNRCNSFSGLVSLVIGDDRGFTPLLDDLPEELKNRKVDFETYWKKAIFVDNLKNKFSRRDLILFMTDQDGGAHVDPVLNKKYAALTRQNSLGWSETINNVWKPMVGVELFAIRQIAHEILKSLIPDYKPNTAIEKRGMVLSDIRIIMEDTAAHSSPTYKLGRNDQCLCGSGKKWKKCGLINTAEHQLLIAAK